MSTSGNTIFELSRDDIINAAMRKLVALSKGQSADTIDLQNLGQALNLIVLEFQTLGMPLWARKEYTLTLLNGVSSYSIGVGQVVNTPFPLKMHQIILKNTQSQSQIDVQLLSVYDFNLLPQGTINQGQPVNATYQPFVNYGVLRVWPTPDATIADDYTMKLVYQRPFEVFDSGTDTPDFPQEWGNALIYRLALNASDEFGLPIEDKRWLKQQADEHLMTALSNGNEDASLFFQMHTKGY